MTVFAPLRARLTRVAGALLTALRAAVPLPLLRALIGLAGLAAIAGALLHSLHGLMATAVLLLWLILEIGFMPLPDGALALVALVVAATVWPARPQPVGTAIANDSIFLVVGFLILGAVARLRAARAKRNDALERLQAALAERDLALGQLRTALTERDAALADARAALRVRDDFLAAANHDLRTPLTAIVGYSALIEQRLARGDATPERLVQTVRPLVSGARRMARIVDDIGDATAVQTGRAMELRRETVDLGALAAGVAATTPAASGADRLRLALPDRPLCIEADKARVERVLQNVIDNALKYSDAAVSIAVRAEGPVACIKVSDHGYGIPPDELSRIFTRYYRASNAPTHAGGTGIGLATARAIVERHGGTIDIVSAVGEGTTVTVRLPRDGGYSIRPPQRRVGEARLDQLEAREERQEL